MSEIVTHYANAASLADRYPAELAAVARQAYDALWVPEVLIPKIVDMERFKGYEVGETGPELTLEDGQALIDSRLKFNGSSGPNRESMHPALVRGHVIWMPPSALSEIPDGSGERYDIGGMVEWHMCLPDAAWEDLPGFGFVPTEDRTITAVRVQEQWKVDRNTGLVTGRLVHGIGAAALVVPPATHHDLVLDQLCLTAQYPGHTLAMVPIEGVFEDTYGDLVWPILPLPDMPWQSPADFAAIR